MSDELATPDGAPRPPVVRLALAALALTLVFMVLRFPYERVAGRIAERVERDTGARIALGSASLGLVRWAPGLAARDVRITTADGARIHLDRLGVRPALAFSWLRGRASWGVELASEQGRASGVVVTAAPASFDGRVEGLDLALLPQDGVGPGVRLDGRADADVDLVFSEAGPVGRVAFDAREGTVAHPQLPTPLPFQKLDGEIELGGEAIARIVEVNLESPLAKGRAVGTIGQAASLALAPLQLEIGLDVSAPVRGSLNAQGVKVGEMGQVVFRISGTVGRPVVK